MKKNMFSSIRVLLQIAGTLALIGSGTAFGAVLCNVTTLAKHKAMVADSNAYSAILIHTQATASSVRQRLMNAYSQLEKNQEAGLAAQIRLFSVPPSSNRSEEFRNISYSQYLSRDSYSNAMYSVNYSLTYAHQALNSSARDFASTCVTQGTLDLEAAVRLDLDNVSNMFKPAPVFQSITSLLPQ